MHLRALKSALVLAAGALSFPVVLPAQACPARPNPSFAFQVDVEAVPIDSTIQGAPRPADPRTRPPNADVAVVQFVVDTLGVPDPATYRVLRAGSTDAAERARTHLSRWRFTPARIGGCRVAQLVQTWLQS